MSKPTLKMTHGAIGEAMCCYTNGSYADAAIALTEYENSIRTEAIKEFAEEYESSLYGRCKYSPEHCKKDLPCVICYANKYIEELKGWKGVKR